jgi:hypothetical protein
MSPSEWLPSRPRIAWIRSLDPAKGARLQALIDQIRWD